MALEAILERLPQTALERGMRRGQSFRDILMSNHIPAHTALHTMNMQVKSICPWALLVHVEPAAKKEVVIMDVYELFQVCMRGTTIGKSPLKSWQAFSSLVNDRPHL